MNVHCNVLLPNRVRSYPGEVPSYLIKIRVCSAVQHGQTWWHRLWHGHQGYACF